MSHPSQVPLVLQKTSVFLWYLSGKTYLLELVSRVLCYRFSPGHFHFALGSMDLVYYPGHVQIG